MIRYVLDCSVAVQWFVPEPFSEIALPLLQRLQSGSLSFLIPDSFTVEFGHAMRRLVLGERLSPERAHRAMARMLQLPIQSSSSRELAPRALELSLAHMATFYDALYIALAEREDLMVLTADDGMVNAFARLGRAVRLADLAEPTDPHP